MRLVVILLAVGEVLLAVSMLCLTRAFLLSRKP